uniref:Uncharacterized protein n=1 Tax=Pararge aegeria TaxID=116150 RepID=S4P8C2_9NEOP
MILLAAALYLLGDNLNTILIDSIVHNSLNFHRTRIFGVIYGNTLLAPFNGGAGSDLRHLGSKTQFPDL